MREVDEVLLAVEGIRESPDYTRVECPPCCSVGEIGALYRSVAVLCIQKEINRLLIISSNDDPAGPQALRDSFTVMLLAGLPPGFRVALVGSTATVVHAYGTAHRDLRAAKVDAGLFDAEKGAVRWLGRPNARLLEHSI